MPLSEIFLLTFAKYFVFCGISYLIFYIWFPGKFEHLKIQKKPRPSMAIKKEVIYSVISISIQAVMIFGIAFGAENGIFKVTRGLDSLSTGQQLLAFGFYFLVYDTYFYFSHALLHRPWFYKHIHKIHHLSLNPNPWSSYSFHPIEAIVNFAYVYFIVLVMPMTWELLWFIFILSDFGNIGGHLGFELLPKKLLRSRFGRWITTPTHHNLHHQAPGTNYGLYWNGWDKILKTLNPKTYGHPID